MPPATSPLHFSAFVSASQSPFFSPRSPPPLLITPQITVLPSQITISPSDASPCHASSSDTSLAYHGKKGFSVEICELASAELEAQGISCFACDQARCRSSRSQSHVEKIMNFTTFGVVIITKKSFGNPYTIEELRHFFSRRNLVPIYFDLGPSDCLARDIVERRGDMWEKHGGELWVLYGGLEREWREVVEELSRAFDLQLEVGCGNWRDCILEAVSVLAKKLGRRSVVDRIIRWRENRKRGVPLL